MKTIPYNPLSLILLNLPENGIGLFANWTQWSKNEDELINKAINNHVDQPIYLFNVIENQINIDPITTSVIEQNAHKHNITFVNYYIQSNTFRDYQNGLEQFNLIKIYATSNFKHINDITNIKTQKEIVEYKNILVSQASQSNHLLKNGDVENYYILNKAFYSFNGEVVLGNSIGRTLGYPTANLLLANLPLKMGVYIVKIKLPNDEREYDGIATYWINNKNDAVFETNILDFEKDIYGWNITINVVKFIRDNKKISSREELINLLDNDKAFCLNYIKTKGE